MMPRLPVTILYYDISVNSVLFYTHQPRYDRGVPSTRGRQPVSLDRSLTARTGPRSLGTQTFSRY